MTHRSKHMPFYCILVGGLLISVGFNILQYNRIKALEAMTVQNWLSVQEYEMIQREINRLDNVKYPQH